MNTFANKTVLITGASSGIGESFARLLAAQKANLILVARSKNKLEDLAQKLMAEHQIAATYFLCDLSQPDAVLQLYRDISRAKLSVDVLINNAGFGKWGSFLDYTLNDYTEMVNLNILSLTQLCHLFLPSMIQRAGGGIINVASTAAFIPVPFAAVYSASKSYVLFFSEALHGECQGSGVKVLALCPGGTETNFAKVANPKPRKLNGRLESPDLVAENGLKAFLKGSPSLISGSSNKVVEILPRLLPRNQIIKLSGWVWKKALGLKSV